MGKWTGLGDRISSGIKARGFVNKQGGADVQRFALAHGYLPNYVYRWIKETTTPEHDNLLRLAKDLRTDPARLLFGEGTPDARPTKRVRGQRLAGLLLALGLGWAAVDPHPVDAARAPWTAPPLPVASRLAGRGILSSWRVQWGWWGAVADSYLALAWRRGLTSFRSWPRVSMEPYGA